MKFLNKIKLKSALIISAIAVILCLSNVSQGYTKPIVGEYRGYAWLNPNPNDHNSQALMGIDIQFPNISFNKPLAIDSSSTLSFSGFRWDFNGWGTTAIVEGSVQTTGKGKHAHESLALTGVKVIGLGYYDDMTRNQVPVIITFETHNPAQHPESSFQNTPVTHFKICDYFNLNTVYVNEAIENVVYGGEWAGVDFSK